MTSEGALVLRNTEYGGPSILGYKRDPNYVTSRPRRVGNGEGRRKCGLLWKPGQAYCVL